ncbi:MAG: flagellar protein FliS [Clostridiales bacterium]|jgi:flagellar protein FliS|nr:flagellar protein FliS [Clostridiales bacterium]
MEKEDYVAKISNATPVGLVIINFELLVESVELALGNTANGNTEEFEANVNKAKDFLMLLMKSLNFEYDISKQFLKAYIHINALLNKAFFSKKTEPLNEAASLLKTMLADWREILKIENAQPVMENSQKLFAGLTYKNGELEEYIPEEETRGFKA